MNEPTLFIIINEWEFWAEYCYDVGWGDDEESYTGGAVYFDEDKEICIFLSEWDRVRWVDVTVVNFLVACYIHELIHWADIDAIERLVVNAEFALVGWITDGKKRQA